MLSAAPVPRPPQPIRPTLITSLPAACALFSRPRPMVAAVEPRRKFRRVADDPWGEVGSVMVGLLVLFQTDPGPGPTAPARTKFPGRTSGSADAGPTPSRSDRSIPPRRPGRSEFVKGSD